MPDHHLRWRIKAAVQPFCPLCQKEEVGREASTSSLCPCSWQGAALQTQEACSWAEGHRGSPGEWLPVLGSIRIQERQHLPEQLRQHHPYFMALFQSSVLTAFCPPEILAMIGDILGCRKREVVFWGSSHEISGMHGTSPYNKELLGPQMSTVPQRRSPAQQPLQRQLCEGRHGELDPK